MNCEYNIKIIWTKMANLKSHMDHLSNFVYYILQILIKKEKY